MAECVYYIYALLDPYTREKRYIGKTNDPERRMKQHLEAPLSDQTRRARWIRLLQRNSVDPIMKIIETVPIGGDENERERYWIDYYRVRSPLTNLTDGGDGGKRSPETIAKLREFQRERGKRREVAIRDQVIEMYVGGASIDAIKKALKAGDPIVHRILAEAGISIRGPKRKEA